MKVGGRYQMDDGHIVVDSIAPITRAEITYDLAHTRHHRQQMPA